MKTTLKIVAAIIGTTALGFAAVVTWLLLPHDNFQPMPAPLVAANSKEGLRRLNGAEAIADYQQLLENFQAQALVSYCGVASSVSVLNAFGIQAGQFDFFTEEASRVRSRFKVMFGGMSLLELGGLLDAHGLQITRRHMDGVSLAEFRATLKKNLSHAGDYLIVNYQREVLGQGRVGHISPASAYDKDSDSVLIMDTASHKYPPTWVPLELLYAAMKTSDSASGTMRGFIEVSKFQARDRVWPGTYEPPK